MGFMMEEGDDEPDASLDLRCFRREMRHARAVVKRASIEYERRGIATPRGSLLATHLSDDRYRHRPSKERGRMREQIVKRRTSSSAYNENLRTRRPLTTSLHAYREPDLKTRAPPEPVLLFGYLAACGVVWWSSLFEERETDRMGTEDGRDRQRVRAGKAPGSGLYATASPGHHRSLAL